MLRYPAAIFSSVTAAIFSSVTEASQKGVSLYFITGENTFIFYTIYGGSHELEIVTHV